MWQVSFLIGITNSSAHPDSIFTPQLIYTALKASSIWRTWCCSGFSAYFFSIIFILESEIYSLLVIFISCSFLYGRFSVFFFRDYLLLYALAYFFLSKSNIQVVCSSHGYVVLQPYLSCVLCLYMTLFIQILAFYLANVHILLQIKQSYGFQITCFFVSHLRSPFCECPVLLIFCDVISGVILCINIFLSDFYSMILFSGVNSFLDSLMLYLCDNVIVCIAINFGIFLYIFQICSCDYISYIYNLYLPRIICLYSLAEWHVQ